MTDTNIELVQGTTLAFGLEFEGLDQDLDTAYFTCKESYSAESYTFRKSIGDGIEKVETNKYRVRVAPEDTENVDAGVYYYILEIGVNSDVFPLLKGSLIIESNVNLPEQE